jgi:murein DD-endopeptidase MepM/ murein hydrolase activator NlpD
MAMAGFETYKPKTGKAEKGIWSLFKDIIPEEKDITPMLIKAGDISARLDSAIKIINENKLSAQAMPTSIPVKGKNFITRGFGMNTDPFSGRRVFHEGIDFAGAAEEPVYAAGKGTVIKAGGHAVFGKVVRIRHGQNIETMYAHLETIQVQKGKQVSRGQVIGSLGSSGLSTGPHLHFEISIGGRKIDPSRFYPEEFISKANPAE